MLPYLKKKVYYFVVLYAAYPGQLFSIATKHQNKKIKKQKILSKLVEQSKKVKNVFPNF